MNNINSNVNPFLASNLDLNNQLNCFNINNSFNFNKKDINSNKSLFEPNDIKNNTIFRNVEKNDITENKNIFSFSNDNNKSFFFNLNNNNTNTLAFNENKKEDNQNIINPFIMNKENPLSSNRNFENLNNNNIIQKI